MMIAALPAGRPPARVAGMLVAAGLTVTALVGCSAGSGSAQASPPPVGATPASSGSPGASTPEASRTNVYAHAGAGMLTPVTRRARSLVYVPNLGSNSVDVIDPRTYRIVSSFAVPAQPQHVVPSWDMRTLWVNDNKGNALTPIDPATGRPGRSVPVDDPYNLYFSPDGKHAIVMAEARERIDFRDPHTMRLQHSLHIPCRGVNHADFTADLRTFLVSCEYSGKLLVVPADGSRVTSVIDLNGISTPGATDPMAAMMGGGPAEYLDPDASAMPQDVRLAPDGRTFVVADMLRNGLWLVDAATFTVRGFLPTGKGAHGVYPSRDGTALYVSNRDEGTISVVDAATLTVRARWVIPGGGSPDMGGVTADGRQLWLSGRSNSTVYVVDTADGHLVTKIRVGLQPHGLCVWPQPGRFSLGHTGNTR
ncbi:MAG TPA: YncE family protein [Kineosporiaceae bacterium]|nr:YncE family protein [Kineosporiaceae bacterium]